MSISIHEKFGSGSRVDNMDSPSDGGESDSAILTALEAAAPATYSGMMRMNVSIDPMEGNGYWLGRCSYGRYDWSYTFDTSGGSRHVIASKCTMAFGPGADGADNGNLIGVTGDNVEGVDITIPVYNFSETHCVDEATMTTAYKQILFKRTGTVNNAAFKGFAEGEVLFTGATGNKRSANDWEITFHFQASPNRLTSNTPPNPLTIGSITNIQKKGWEYVWVRYRQQAVGGLNLLGQVPVAVYVERLYDEADFSTLGIGT